MEKKITQAIRRLVMLTALSCCLSAVAFAQYCLPSYNNPCTTDDYINSVTFAGINNLNTGCGTPGTNNYTNFSGSITATVTVNQPNTITVAPGPTWGQYFVAFIDLNHDGDYADAGEFFDIGYSLGGGQVSSTITIPCGSLTGVTRLRVMCRYANTPLTQADVCTTGLSFGEVEEYSINILPASGTDGAITRFISPVSSCGMGTAEQVRIRVKNVGGTTINGYTICYSVNNGAPVCETVSTVILACDSVIHTFATPANLGTPGTYDFDATLTVAGDGNLPNNALTNVMVDNIPVIGTIPYAQNWDVTTGGWTSFGNSTTMAWGAPVGTFINQASTAPNAWVTNLGGLYNPDELSYLLSPCFNMGALTADPYVSLAQIREMPGFGDVAYLELTTNAGATWSKVGTAVTGNNWYNNTFDVAWNGNSGNPGRWVDSDHQLVGAAGSTSVRVRFVFDSDAFTEMEGFGVDDFRIWDTLRNVAVTQILSPASGCQLGAAVPITVEVRNLGSHPVSNVPVCFKLNAGPSICETVPGPIAPGTTATYTFTATANLSALGNYNVMSYANWSQDYTHDNDTVRGIASNYSIVSTFPYRENFETSNGGWASGGPANNDWAWGDPNKTNINTAGNGLKCWITAGLAPGSYLDNTNNWVESPCFDLSTLSNPWVLLKVNHRSESGYDGAILESSTNGGLSWQQVGAYLDPNNWYNEDGLFGLSNNGLTGDGWAGFSGGWLQAKHALNNLGGQPGVRFRIHFGSDGSVTDEGFAFDDFIIAQPPIFNIGADTTICSSLTLNPGLTNGTYLWSTGATTSTLTINQAGTYSLAFTDSLGLTGHDTIVVSLTPTPSADLGPNRNICVGDTTCLTLSASSYPSVVWSTGSTSNQICVGTAGTWNVEATDPLGCISRDTITTSMVALPTPFIGADTAVCAGDTVCLSLNCGPNHTYLWSTGATTAQICVALPIGYWGRCIDQNGCVGADTIFVTTASMPVAGASADTLGCPVVAFTNTSTGTNSFWDFGDGNTSTSANPTHDYTASGNGSYLVTHITSNACGNDTVTLPVNIGCLVGVRDGNANLVRIAPNPNAGTFNLTASLDGLAQVNVRILDVHGKLVYAHDFGQMAGRFSQPIRLDVARGVYYVHVAMGETVVVRKLVVQ